MADDPDPLDLPPAIPRSASERPGRRGGPDVPILRVIAGRDVLRFAVVGGPVEIGRDAACGLSLNDSSVSRRHARVRPDRAGFEVEDLGSRNGTFVNGRRVERERLALGDRLEVGTVPLRFEPAGPDELAHLQGVLERLAAGDRDPLTGLLTRSYLEGRLPTLVEECRRAGRPVSTVFLDVDHFKSINDEFGHATGDDALRQVARLLAYGVRARESCVRYGGEEVIVVLEGATEGEAVVVAERLRRLVESHEWSAVAGGLEVTVSCGVAQCLPGQGVREWLARADRALYAAKRSGRNRVCRASQFDPD
jgi:diguanylate cyclase (GGDEF)-like protein